MGARSSNVDVVVSLFRRSKLPGGVRYSAPDGEMRARVDVQLVLGESNVTVRFENRDASRRAFARTPSFDVAHLGSALPPDASRLLSATLRALAAADPGGLELRAEPPEELSPQPIHASSPEGAGPVWLEYANDAPRRLPIVDARQAWTKSIFDQRTQTMLDQGARADSVVVVVQQACEMACQFCPPGDREVEELESTDTHYDDLIHQSRRGRKFGATDLELGGNDVLRFPRIVELIQRIAGMGYSRIVAQSPGHALSNPEIGVPLAQVEGLVVAVPIYGASAAEHEWVTRVPGSFDGLCEFIDAAQSRGGPAIELQTIAFHQECDRLISISEFAHARFGLPVRVNPLRGNREGLDGHLQQTATIDELRPVFARLAHAVYPEFPLCAAPVERVRERMRAPAWDPPLNLFDVGLPIESNKTRTAPMREPSHVDGCTSCVARGACAGLLGSYRAHVDERVQPWTEARLAASPE